MRTPARIAAAVALVGALAACTPPTSAANRAEQKATAEIASAMVANQPIPSASWSQQRETLRQIITMQVNTTPTFTYFFAPGRSDARPVFSCQSIGDPIPATFQLTNPESQAGNHEGGYFTIPQMEPTGVFSGETDGTNVLCLKDDGQLFKIYWEGQVMSTTLPLIWDGSTLTADQNATPTYEFKAGK